jgi:hypothetical protein
MRGAVQSQNNFQFNLPFQAGNELLSLAEVKFDHAVVSINGVEVGEATNVSINTQIEEGVKRSMESIKNVTASFKELKVAFTIDFTPLRNACQGVANTIQELIDHLDPVMTKILGVNQWIRQKYYLPPLLSSTYSRQLCTCLIRTHGGSIPIIEE